MQLRCSVACCATALRGEHAGSTRRNYASGLVHTPGASLTTTSALVPCSEEFLLPPIHRCPCLLRREGRLGWEMRRKATTERSLLYHPASWRLHITLGGFVHE